MTRPKHPRRGARPQRGPVAGVKWPLLPLAGDADSLAAWAHRYLSSCEVAGLSPQTVADRHKGLAGFVRWCSERELTDPRHVTRPVLERYQKHLYLHRKQNGNPLSAGCQHARIRQLQGFFRHLVRQNHLLSNPASELELPKLPARSLREPMSPEEVERVMAAPDVADLYGLRDRAILELLYSTGLRRGEVAHLTLHDVDFARGTVFVRQGKGRKDRFVPIGERALAWVRKYLDQARPRLAQAASAPQLFLNLDGGPLSCDSLSALTRRYYQTANLHKPGACHLFRHSMATHMLDNGADVRFIQEMLGHAQLSTTQIYTHVSIGKLKAIHTATHPAARLKRSAGGGCADAPADRLESGRQPDALAADVQALRPARG